MTMFKWRLMPESLIIVVYLLIQF